MTGYGSAQYENNKATLSVEVRTLNSKFLDLQLKLPKEFSDKEIEVRNTTMDSLKRGKAVVTVEISSKSEGQTSLGINQALFKGYYNELSKLAKDSQVTDSALIFKLALDMPEVRSSTENPEELMSWQEIKSQLQAALDKCIEFRKQEGSTLASKLESYRKSIAEQLDHIDIIDPDRISRIKDRIRANLEEFVRAENIDQNRLEQELIYYIEKLDINEEKVRLKNHLDYFSEVMTREDLPGKKLSFVSQEMGREINTIGSKANDSAIQRHVVIMKEELEKIKEQLLNIV